MFLSERVLEKIVDEEVMESVHEFFLFRDLLLKSKPSKLAGDESLRELSPARLVKLG